MIHISVGEILERAAFFLNDVNRAFYTDAVLLPPFKVAYDDLREELFGYNIQITNNTSLAISITAGVTDIGGTSGPPLPTNFMSPIQLFERPAGTEQDYTLMEHKKFLPKNFVIIDQLLYWSYQDQVIKFLGATGDNEVKIDYVGDSLSVAEDVADQINLFNAKSFLSYRTAALASEYLGENTTRAGSLNINAGTSLDNLLNTDIKNQQDMPVRRRPFNYIYRRPMW